LTFIEKGGNKRAREFFRQHGVTGSIDYAGQVANRWRNELSEEVSQ
jgi:hypothetical protein